MTREEIYLAALLHDIGKFYQRADDKGSEISTKLSQQIKNLEDILCPLNSKGFSHKHVLWTAQFFEDQKDLLGNVLKKSGCGNIDQLLLLASKHHNPESIYEKVIQKADHYSAGMDRTNEPSWKDAEKETNTDWDSFKKIRMRSAFGLINLNNNDGKDIDLNKIKEIPFCTLSIADDYINYEKEESYAELWKLFLNDIEKLRETDINIFSETVGFLLEKYTTRIPASTVNFPDVSLFDHSKTTAAFAIALFDFIIDNKYNELPSSDKKPFLLVGGDLTGIQKFIYGIATHGAAKNLKGRSFYLQMLVDSIVAKLLHILKLPSSSVIFKSGGNFYLLAPNTENTKLIISNYIKEIENKLFDYHGTQLYLAIEFLEFGEETLFNDIGELWNELAEKINLKKKKKFITIIKENYDKLFGNKIVNIDNNLGRDYITGDPIVRGEDTIQLDTDIEDSVVKEYTYKQINLGKLLKDAQYWIISFFKIPYWDDDFLFEPIGIGCYNYLVNDEKINRLKKELKGSGDNLIVRKLNSIDFLEDVSKGFNNVYGFIFYAGNDYPKDTNGQPKVFEELAGVEFKDERKEERKTSPDLVRLGVLRMDVDNLGTIFKEGYRKKYRSFSRYASLSRNLDLFFSGYLNTLWLSKEEYKQYTQIIYAGGDDLFIVGKWDVVISLAKEIKLKFSKFTCSNSNITISGGVAIVPPKYPILKAADFSEKEEKNAKKHCIDNIKKDSFSVFGYAFNWSNEFENIFNLKEKFRYLFESGLPSTFANYIFVLMSRAYPKQDDLNENLIKTSEIFKIRSKWLIAYNFKRAAIRSSTNKQVEEFYKEWSKNIFVNKIDMMPNTKYSALQILAIAARWAEFELRSQIKNE